VDHLIPSLAALTDPFRTCFARPEVFATFQHLLAGWIVALGPRTLSEVWPATGRAADHHGDTAYSFFASAKWNWDDLGKLLVRMVVARLLPTGAIWIVVDDTLCHKRGAQVAFGGFVLDAVTSTERAKNFRFGINWVVVGRSVHLPFRPDRAFTLPVLWRAYRKKGTDGHHTRAAMAAELARLVATWLPERDCRGSAITRTRTRPSWATGRRTCGCSDRSGGTPRCTAPPNRPRRRSRADRG